MTATKNRGRRLAIHILIGAILGVLLLHPITKVVYWIEFREELANESLWTILLSRLQTAFILEMVPMNIAFGFIGGLIGCGFGLYHCALVRRDSEIAFLETELTNDLPSLIELGENERVEFKSSLRWDLKQEKMNPALEHVIIKTIAGFMNGVGGTLLLGVDDDGNVTGIENDYSTLKKKNGDGFQLAIMDLISSRIGVDFTSLTKIIIHNVADNDVCRLIIHSSNRPVYVINKNQKRFFLRTGPSTREMNIEEAVRYIQTHFNL